MKKVLLRGGHFGECVVELEDDINGVIITAHYSEVEKLVMCKETEEYIYTNTGHGSLVNYDDGSFESMQVFEVDFPKMRGVFQWELL